MQYFRKGDVTLKFEISPQVYPPSDDSFLLAENTPVKREERVLDMGTGCGIQGIIASKSGGNVVACDISEKAVECAAHNAELNSADMEVVRSDLFENLNERFNLILFNPPYLISEPSDPDDDLRKAWDGGVNGRKVTNRFLSMAGDYLSKDGRIMLVQSSLNNLKATTRNLKKLEFSYRTVAEKNIFFEKLYLLEIARVSRNKG